MRFRFVIGMGLMLLPLVVVGTGAFLFFQSAIGSFEEVAEEVVEELLPVTGLQTLVYRASRPVHDYLIEGDPVQRERFPAMSQEVEQAFAVILEGPLALPGEKELITSARAEWQQARAIGEDLLKRVRPIGDPNAAYEMRRVDAHIERSVDLLSQVSSPAQREIEAELAQARSVSRVLLLITTVVFGLGLVAAVGAATLLARSILVPLRALEDGAKRIGEGSLSHRVALVRRDELGRLAEAFNDMGERLQKSQGALEDLSVRDGLTGLFNSREFHRRLKEHLEESRRYGHSLSLVMLDLDHFKDVNDTYGHQAGDQALRAIAGLISGELRAVDQVARYGGEEFVIILPETPLSGAVAVAERIRLLISSRPVAVGQGNMVNVTVSIGVASLPREQAGDMTEDGLVAAADQALYVAKHQGRNRVSPPPGA